MIIYILHNLGMLYIRTYSTVALAPAGHTQKALRNILSEPLTRESAEQSSLLAEVEQLCLSARHCSEALGWISLFSLEGQNKKNLSSSYFKRWRCHFFKRYVIQTQGCSLDKPAGPKLAGVHQHSLKWQHHDMNIHPWRLPNAVGKDLRFVRFPLLMPQGNKSSFFWTWPIHIRTLEETKQRISKNGKENQRHIKTLYTAEALSDRRYPVHVNVDGIRRLLQDAESEACETTRWPSDTIRLTKLQVEHRSAQHRRALIMRLAVRRRPTGEPARVRPAHIDHRWAVTQARFSSLTL